MLNTVTLQGRLTKDPELRYTNNQIAVCSFTLAVEDDFKPENGERKVAFIDCVAWRGTAEFINKYFAKGSLAAVTGRIQVRTWKDDNGNNRRNTEVLVDHVYFCGSKKDGGSVAATDEDFQELDENDGDLPF